jgi:predicted transcriptional regulator
MPEAEPTSDVAALTVQLLSAYLANNTVPSEELAGLIRSTRDALTQEAETLGQEEPETFTPAISVRKSLASPDHIISLIDGKPYKTLKRHLMGHGLTPESYRSRYNLPANYPMVAPAYAEHRRDIARKAGLGSKRPAVEATTASDVDAPLSASFDGTQATKTQAMPQDIAETGPSAGKKKSKASSKPKALASKEATLDDVAAASDTGQAPAAEHDTPAAAPKAKRRAKLGLFGDAEAKSDQASSGSAAQSAESPSAPREPARDEASTEAPVKRKSSKRMARTPDTSSDIQGIGRDNQS